MEGLVKLAASFDARRNKQYWQLLKKTFGSGDDAIKGVKALGDDGIYHGTVPRAVPSILEQGMKPSMTSAFGRGQYFGGKHIGGAYSTGGLIRFKKPSELKGTKQLYPIQKAKGVAIGVDTNQEMAEKYKRKQIFPMQRKIQDIDIDIERINPDRKAAVSDREARGVPAGGLFGKKQKLENKLRKRTQELNKVDGVQGNYLVFENDGSLPANLFVDANK